MNEDARRELLRVRRKSEELKHIVAEERTQLPIGETGDPIEDGLADCFSDIEHILDDIYEKLGLLPLHNDLVVNIANWVSDISGDAIEIAMEAREIADPGQSTTNAEIILSKLKALRNKLMGVLDMIGSKKETKR